MTLLQLVEYVVSETQGCQLASSTLAHVRMALRVLSKRMGITEMGAFFLCWLLNNFHDRHLLIADLEGSWIVAILPSSLTRRM